MDMWRANRERTAFRDYLNRVRRVRLTTSICTLSLALVVWGVSTSCSITQHSSTRSGPATLADYAAHAKARGSHEALVPYAADEEEGEMLIVRSLEEAMAAYEWVVGEPIEEKTFGAATIANTRDFSSIFTAYRFRIIKRFGRSQDTRAPNDFEKRRPEEMPVNDQEILVLKSGGNLKVQDVLLKKRGALCFAELLPRTYLLALRMDSSDRVGWLEMGCRSIFTLSGDRLIPRELKAEPVTSGMKARFNNSLIAFQNAFLPHESRH